MLRKGRRPNVVVVINGLPLALIELKNAADEDATIWNAYAQRQTYKAEVPRLLNYNAADAVAFCIRAESSSTDSS